MTLYSFDTETFLITKRRTAPEPVCISIADAQNTYLIKPNDPWFAEALADPNNIWVGHNVFYDIDVLLCWLPHLIPDMMRAVHEGRVFDTGIRWQLRHLKRHGDGGYNPRVSLSDLEKKYLGIDRSLQKHGEDIWRLKYGTLHDIPIAEWPEDAKQYALDDARGTYDVFIQLGGLDDFYPTEYIQIRGGCALHAASVWGFHINLEKHADVKAKLEAEVLELDPKVLKLGWSGKGSQKVMQAAVQDAWRVYLWTTFEEYLLEVGFLAAYIQFDKTQYDFYDTIQQYMVNNDPTCGGIAHQGADVMAVLGRLPTPPRNKAKRNSKTGEITVPYVTDIEVLKTLGKYNPDFALHTEHKHLKNMLSTFLKAHEYETIHCRFGILKVTGRSGCESPNLQNVPDTYRSYFDARAGYVLSVNDYSAVELCTFASTCLTWFGYSHMADAINAGMDLHSRTAASIIEMDYEEFMVHFNNKGTHEPTGLPYKTLRQGAKPTNFGRPGGLGDEAQVSYAERQYGVKMTLEEANSSKKVLLKLYPEMKQYLALASSDVRKGKGKATAITTTGRERAGCRYTERANSPFQGLAADGGKLACWAIHMEHMLAWYHQNIGGDKWGSEYKDSPLVDTHMVNFIHDELVNEVPEGEEGVRAHNRIQEIMISSMSSVVPGVTIRVEGELGEGWAH